VVKLNDLPIPLKMKCPKCKAVLEPYVYANTVCHRCENCGYDSCEDKIFPQQKTNQREKARFSPYKSRK
jgi:hypothetical protein